MEMWMARMGGAVEVDLSEVEKRLLRVCFEHLACTPDWLRDGMVEGGGRGGRRDSGRG
jgi:hypothetical protein